MDEIIKVVIEDCWLVRCYLIIYGIVNNIKVFYVLNEFNICFFIIRMFMMDFYINDFYFEIFCGDGMVIFILIGSIVYNKLVNGFIVDLFFLFM